MVRILQQSYVETVTVEKLSSISGGQLVQQRDFQTTFQERSFWSIGTSLVMCCIFVFNIVQGITFVLKLSSITIHTLCDISRCTRNK